MYAIRSYYASINIGLKAVPIHITAAMLIPADMPEISDKHINKMIKAHKPDNNKEIIMSSYKKVKKNPIIWPRRLFNQANLLVITSYSIHYTKLYDLRH